MEELPRRLEPIARDALAGFRVVVITGPRQAGKTTLVRRMLGGASVRGNSAGAPLCFGTVYADHGASDPIDRAPGQGGCPVQSQRPRGRGC